MCCSPPQVNVFLPTKLWCKKGWDHSPYFADGKTQAPWLVMGGLFAQQLIHIMPQLYKHILGVGHYGRCCWHDPTLSSEQATFGLFSSGQQALNTSLVIRKAFLRRVARMEKTQATPSEEQLTAVGANFWNGGEKIMSLQGFYFNLFEGLSCRRGKHSESSGG